MKSFLKRHVSVFCSDTKPSQIKEIKPYNFRDYPRMFYSWLGSCSGLMCSAAANGPYSCLSLVVFANA